MTAADLLGKWHLHPFNIIISMPTITEPLEVGHIYLLILIKAFRKKPKHFTDLSESQSILKSH